MLYRVAGIGNSESIEVLTRTIKFVVSDSTLKNGVTNPKDNCANSRVSHIEFIYVLSLGCSAETRPLLGMESNNVLTGSAV